MTRLSPVDELPATSYRGVLGSGAVFERLTRTLATSERVVVPALAFAIVVALLAPLGPLASNRFHRDEAIYSSWGLDIASGRDLLLGGSPVDKPPLFFYIQALSFTLFGPTEVAARTPSLVASVVSVGLIYALGRSLYGRGVGLLAAFLLAASPYAILFAPTAFTDPLMVTWMLAGCLAAVRGHWVWGGVFIGLAAITKQQGVFFVPLALGLGLASSHKAQIANHKLQIANHKSQISGCIICGGFYGGVGSGLCLGRRPGTPSGLPGPEPDQLWGAVALASDGLGTFAGLCKLAAIRHGLSGYEPRFADRAATVTGDGWSPLSGRFENIPQQWG
jgi:hypothetical protein